MANEVSTELTTQEETFISGLIEGLKPQQAAEEAGFCALYGYALRKKLAKHIVEAAQDYLSLHAVKAARKVVDSVDMEMPNPIHLQAAQALLDRVGVIKKDNTPITTVKASIFILPEKRVEISTTGITIDG